MNDYTRPIAVIGLGVTGLSCIKFLDQQGYSLIAVDTRENPPTLSQCKADFPHLQYRLGEITEATLADAQMIVLSPGVSPSLTAIAACQKKGIPVIGDIELFARYCQAPIIAITGTNGKSTVTTLVGELLTAAGYQTLVGGNIGTPALDLLAKQKPNYYVLELSSFQLDLTFSLQAKIATILNISPDHLDRHKTMSHYIASKQRIYQQCEFAIYNRADQNTIPTNSPHQALISFGLDEPEAKQFGIRSKNNESYLAMGDRHLLSTKQLRIVGRHNWQNALAALAITNLCVDDIQQVLPSLQQFPGLPHRCQWVTEAAGVTWYNDSKGTNVGATCSAIEGLGSTVPGKIILIAGGQGKGASFEALRATAQPYVRNVLLIGQDAKLIAQSLDGHIPYQHAANLEDAVIIAKSVAQAGDAVLLSPACASFDSFKNFEHRGTTFTQLVKELVKHE